MLINVNKTLKNILSLPRYAKQITVVIFDIGLCILCTWLAFYLRLEEFISINGVIIVPILLSIFLSVPIFWLLGLYKEIFRFTGLSIFFSIFIAILIYALVYFSVIGIYVIEGVPRSIGIIQPLLLFFSITGSRLLLKYLVITNYYSKNKSKTKKRLLIYGAGIAGRQLATSLENSSEFEVVGFLDDDPRLHNQVMLGQTIFPQSKLKNLIKSKDINLVLLALPSINRNSKKKKLEKI